MCGIWEICNRLLRTTSDKFTREEVKSDKKPVEISKSHEISQSEKKFREKRAPTTMKAIAKLLSDEKGPKSITETPTIALAISGGGYRAVSTSCGAMEAMMENGLFDALMYCVGLSGSVWYMSTTYARKSFTSPEHLKSEHDWIRGQLGKEIEFNAKTSLAYAFKSMFSLRKISLVDVFGKALRDVFLQEHKKAKLSSLKDYVNEAKVPFPIFSVAHVMNNYPIVNFWEEVELTPFEATYASYRLRVPIELVNSAWENGVLTATQEEPFLHYVMGICGCAFAILLYHLTDADESKEKGFWGSLNSSEKQFMLFECCLAWCGLDYINKLLDFATNWRRCTITLSHQLVVIKGLWNVASTTRARREPMPALTEEEFKEKIWPALERMSQDDDDDEILTESEAYKMYQFYVDSDDRSWVEGLMNMIEQDEKREDEEKLGIPLREPRMNRETFGRNIGPFRRTGFLRNPLRGMPNPVDKYMLNDKPIADRKLDSTERISTKAPTDENDIIVVDAGLGCNVPAVHAARPERKVDIILAVDCETKSTELDETFKTLTALQQQMSDNSMKFPTIDIEKLKEDPVKEYYLFEDPDDPDCPVVIWFTLYNVRFRDLANAPRSEEYPPQDDEDTKFNDFDATTDSPEYTTTSLQYAARSVDRLRELMKYNIGANIEIVKDKIARKVQHLRSMK